MYMYRSISTMINSHEVFNIKWVYTQYYAVTVNTCAYTLYSSVALISEVHCMQSMFFTNVCSPQHMTIINV